MKNTIIAELNIAVEKAIESMEPYKSNVEQYNKLIERIEAIQAKSIAKLESMVSKMPKDGIKQSLGIVGIIGAKGLLTYTAQNDGGITDKQGLQLVALIQKHL